MMDKKKEEEEITCHIISRDVRDDITRTVEVVVKTVEEEERELRIFDNEKYIEQLRLRNYDLALLPAKVYGSKQYLRLRALTFSAMGNKRLIVLKIREGNIIVDAHLPSTSS
jgi:isocitrate dehydrogenase